VVVKKITVSWGLKWPGPVNYSTVSPHVSVERTVEDGESVESAIDDAHSLAFQSAVECLQDGLVRLEEVSDEESSRV